MIPRAIYLHGFGSGPGSSKGRFFRERFAAMGWPLELPDLTEGDFEHSTLSKQLAVVDRLAAKGPVVLIGSSMGGYLATLFAARHADRVHALVLMAPAFGMAGRWIDWLGRAAMQEWQQTGWRNVYHYGEERECRISYQLISDGLPYEEFPEVRQPVLVFHGRNDETVDYHLSERFAENRPNVELVLYESDHQLLNMLEPMWEKLKSFLQPQMKAKERK